MTVSERFVYVLFCKYLPLFFLLYCTCFKSIVECTNLTLPKRYNAHSKVVSSEVRATNQLILRIMTLNTFHAGKHVKNGIEKIVKHIRRTNSDIVTLQEVDQISAENIVRNLGPQWIYCSTPKSYQWDTYIFTRKLVTRTYLPLDGFANIGCQVLIGLTPRVLLNIWNVHLNYRHYGPHSACINTKVQSATELEDLENTTSGSFFSRVDSIIKLLRHVPVARNEMDVSKEPMIIAGDFNAPSALDWTKEAKMNHCNWEVAWPVSKILEDHGFIDSYRKVHRSSAANPGTTWSPVYLYHENSTYIEPQDRIDYIYYKSDKLDAVSSQTYFGTQPISYVPNIQNNDWPSDHAAVITDFRLISR